MFKTQVNYVILALKFAKPDRKWYCNHYVIKHTSFINSGGRIIQSVFPKPVGRHTKTSLLLQIRLTTSFCSAFKLAGNSCLFAQ